MSETKANLRVAFKSARQAWLKQQNAVRLSAELANQLHVILKEFPGGFFGCYRPMSPEANPLMAVMQNQQLAWCFPKLEGEILKFYKCDTNTRFAKSQSGFEEPDPGTASSVSLESIQGVLMPLVAFDEKGNRLGQGGGHFDRSLQNYEGLKVGVGYSVQQATNPLPVEEHDVQLDLIVTEKFILKPQRRARQKG